MLDSWLKGFKRSRYAGVLPNNLYASTYGAAIQQLIDRGMEVLILEGVNIATKVGFVAFEVAENGLGAVHWLYIKREYRGLGFGCYLLRTAGIDPAKPFVYTFRTANSKKFPRAVHTPEVARRRNLNPVRIPKRTEHAPTERPSSQTHPPEPS